MAEEQERGSYSYGGKVFKQQEKFEEIHRAVLDHIGVKTLISGTKDAEQKDKLKNISEEGRKKAKSLIKHDFDVTEDVLLTDLEHLMTAVYIEGMLRVMKKGRRGNIQFQWYDAVHPLEEDEDEDEDEEDLESFFRIKNDAISFNNLTLLPINNNN